MASAHSNTENRTGKAPLNTLFGESPSTNIVSTLLTARHESFTIGDLQQLVNVDRQELTTRLGQLEAMGVVQTDGRSNGERRVTLNTGHEIVYHLQFIQERLQGSPNSD